MADTPRVEPVRSVDDQQMNNVIAFCEDFRLVVERRMPEYPDPGEAFGMAMLAAATFSGMLAGHLIVLGAYQDTREQHQQLLQMLMTNFPTGVRLGKFHAERQIAILEGSMS